MKPGKLIPFVLAAAALWLAFGPSLPAIPWPGGQSNLIDGPGLQVLIVEEINDRSKLPRPQLAALTSSKLIDYLASKGGNYRMLDQHQDAAQPPWAAALKRPRTSLPWIVVDSDKGGSEGPLPATEDEMLALVKKWGG